MSRAISVLGVEQKARKMLPFALFGSVLLEIFFFWPYDMN